MVSSNKNKTNKNKDKIAKEANLENQSDIFEGSENEQDEDDEANENELPKGKLFLFGLEKLDYITFEAKEFEFLDGKLVNVENIGKDTMSVLKHKMHRKIYERATAKDTDNDTDNNTGTN